MTPGGRHELQEGHELLRRAEDMERKKVEAKDNSPALSDEIVAVANDDDLELDDADVEVAVAKQPENDASDSTKSHLELEMELDRPEKCAPATKSAVEKDNHAVDLKMDLHDSNERKGTAITATQHLVQSPVPQLTQSISRGTSAGSTRIKSKTCTDMEYAAFPTSTLASTHSSAAKKQTAAKSPKKMRPKSACGLSRISTQKRPTDVRARLQANGPKLMDDRKFVALEASKALAEKDRDRMVQQQTEARQKKALEKRNAQIQRSQSKRRVHSDAASTQGSHKSEAARMTDNAGQRHSKAASPSASHVISERATACFKNGQQLYEKKRFSEAALVFTKALMAGYFDQSLVHCWRGACFDAMCHEGHDKYNEAYEDHNMAIVPNRRTDPSSFFDPTVSAR